MTYLYNDGTDCVFMDAQDYEQFTNPAGHRRRRCQFLLENMTVQVSPQRGCAAVHRAPGNGGDGGHPHDPGLRGDRSTGGTKARDDGEAAPRSPSRCSSPATSRRSTRATAATSAVSAPDAEALIRPAEAFRYPGTRRLQPRRGPALRGRGQACPAGPDRGGAHDLHRRRQRRHRSRLHRDRGRRVRTGPGAGRRGYQFAPGQVATRPPAAVDRAILRLATWELFNATDVDTVVIVDEAVQLAKELSTDNRRRSSTESRRRSLSLLRRCAPPRQHSRRRPSRTEGVCPVTVGRGVVCRQKDILNDPSREAEKEVGCFDQRCPQVLLDTADVNRTISRIAHQIIEKTALDDGDRRVVPWAFRPAARFSLSDSPLVSPNTPESTSPSGSSTSRFTATTCGHSRTAPERTVVPPAGSDNAHVIRRRRPVIWTQSSAPHSMRCAISADRPPCNWRSVDRGHRELRHTRRLCRQEPPNGPRDDRCAPHRDRRIDEVVPGSWRTTADAPRRRGTPDATPAVHGGLEP